MRGIYLLRSWLWLMGALALLMAGPASAATINVLGPTSFLVGSTGTYDVSIDLVPADGGLGAITLFEPVRGADGTTLPTIVSGLTNEVGNPNPAALEHSFNNTLMQAGWSGTPEFDVESGEYVVGQILLTGLAPGFVQFVSTGFVELENIAGDFIGEDVSEINFNLPGLIEVTVPEPSALVLLGASLAGLAFLRRRSV